MPERSGIIGPHPRPLMGAGAVRTARRGSGVSLLKRRTWFDEQGGSGQGQGDPGGQQASAGRYTFASLDEAAKIIEALTKRVGERDAERDALAQRLKDYDAAQQRQLAEQGNYKALAEQHAAEIARLKQIEERANALEAIMRKSNEARIKRVPEQMRSIIPVEYTPEKLQDWLDANEALLTKPPAPDFDAGASGSGGGSRTPELTSEEKQMAQLMNLTPEQYVKQKQAIMQRKVNEQGG